LHQNKAIMKVLLLTRHAKSSWEDSDLADFDRPLNERGKRDAPRMGKRLRERDIHPDIMVTSPARRAFDTCIEIATALKFPESKIKTSQSLYHASEDEILRVVQGLKDHDDHEEVAIVFGHNPGLTDFANRLMNETIDNIPTCGVVGCHLRVTRWQEVTWGAGNLAFFDFPKKK
jgi:phosphohistidine phosphatase